MRANFIVDTLHEAIEHVVNYVLLFALRLVILLVVNVPETERFIIPLVLPEVIEYGFLVFGVYELGLEVVELEF